MNKFHHILHGLQLSRLKKFTHLIPKSFKSWERTLDYAVAHRDEFEKLLPPDFSWALLYELETKRLFILNLAALGILEKVLQAQRDGLDVNQYMMDEAIRQDKEPDDSFGWAGGHDGRFSEADVMAITYATQAAYACMSTYGHYLNDLVKLVREGRDKNSNAFFHAVSIDRTVLGCPTFAARHARAEFFREKPFLLRFRKAVKGQPHIALTQHRDLKTLLQLFHEMNTLKNFSIDEADLLFITELKVYQDRGKDPARSLMRFIQRWRAEKETAT